MIPENDAERRSHFTRRSVLLGLACGAALALPAAAAEAKSVHKSASVPPVQPVKPPAVPRRGDVYLLRGFADIFSTGIDEIGKELQADGINAHVLGHAAWRLVFNEIVADQQKNGRSPVILIGHSLGANAIITIAENLQKRGIAVDYMATFAATAPDPVPGNVRRVKNFYFKQHGWGLPLVAGIAGAAGGHFECGGRARTRFARPRAA